MSQAQTSDSGVYKCMASNELGNATAPAHVVVTGTLSLYSIPRQVCYIRIYRVAQKKRPELCITITARILYEVKFSLAHL